MNRVAIKSWLRPTPARTATSAAGIAPSLGTLDQYSRMKIETSVMTAAPNCICRMLLPAPEETNVFPAYLDESKLSFRLLIVPESAMEFA